MRLKLIAMICLFSINSFADVDVPRLRIKEVKQLIHTIGPENTCMDEYLKRRNQLIIKLSLSPATIVAGTYAATLGGAFLGLGVVYVLDVDPLAGVILGMAGTGAAAGIGTIAKTDMAAFQLADIDRILKTLAEQHVNQMGRKSTKLYAKYARNSKNPVDEETFLRKLIELDNSGELCDGSMLKKPMLASGKKLKHRLARSKHLARHI